MMFEKNEESETERLIQSNINNDQSDINEESLSLNEEEVNSIGVKYKNVNEGMIIKQCLKQKSFYLLSTILCFFNLGSMLMTGNYKVCKN
jgi:hypothetical protein